MGFCLILFLVGFFGVVNLGCKFGGLMIWCSSSDCGVWFEMDCILVKLNFGLLWL